MDKAPAGRWSWLNERLRRIEGAPAQRPTTLSKAPVIVLLLGVVIQSAALTAHARKLWFFGDDWSFLFERSLRQDLVGALFEPHNEHWSTLPVLAFRLLHSMFGVNSYLPYAMMPITLHAVIAVIVYLLLRRAGVAPWASVLAGLMITFLAGGAGAENTLWDFQVGFLGSAALGLIALAALQNWTPAWRAVGVAALVLSLMSSGMGLIMTVWVAAYVLLRRGLLPGLAIAGIPAVVYISWYLAFGRGATGAPPPDLAVAPTAALSGLDSIWSTVLGVEGAGVTVLALAVLVMLVRRHTPEQFALAGSGLVAAFVCYVLIGYSRSGLGVDALSALRYVYFGVLMTTPALALGVGLAGSHLRQRSWAPVVSWSLAASLVVALGLAEAATFAEGRAALIQNVKDRLVAARDMAPSSSLLSDRPEPIYSSPLTLEDLQDPSWTSPIGGRATPQARRDVQASLQVRVDVRTFALPDPDDVSWIGFVGLPAEPRALDSCHSATAAAGARIEFLTGNEGAQVQLRTKGTVQTALVLKDGQSSTPAPAGVSGTSYVGVTAPRTTVRVFVPPGRVTVCPA